MTTTKQGKKPSKKDNGKKSSKKPPKYVYLASDKGVFLVTGEIRESKYSYGVPIIPLQGYYKAKDDDNGGKYRTFTTEELSDYYTILNIPKDDKEIIDAIKKAKIVVFGYREDEVLIVEPENANGGDDNGSAEEN